MQLSIRGQTCHLLAERAVFWEEQKMLILADLHLGKQAVFQKAGIPIPQTMMDDDLTELGKLIERWQPKSCIIVGDLIHAKGGLSATVREQFSQWLQSINCDVHVVLGNHDRALLKESPSEWKITLHRDTLMVKPFLFTHIPQRHPEYFVWAGHLHPTIALANEYDRVVLRCFQVFNDLAIVPAFASFVGGALVQQSNDCKVYAIAEGTVIEV